jgi:arginine deiminase
MGQTPRQIATQLIQGVFIERNNLTRFLSQERFSLRPLHNFLFTRDASMSFGNQVLIGKMASKVRDREAVIMDAIFRNHPLFKATVFNPNSPEVSRPTRHIDRRGRFPGGPRRCAGYWHRHPHKHTGN